MTLLITVFAASITAVLWYNNLEGNMNFGVLSLIYWGASLMWFVDAVVEYIEVGAEYFRPNASDMLNDAYLGLSVVALGLVIWLINVFIKDPNGKIRNLLEKQN